MFHAQFSGRCEGKASVLGGEDEPTAGKVFSHHLGKHRRSCGIEGRARLIEQPDGARSHEKARKREAAPLPRGEIECGQVSKRIEAHGGQRARDPIPPGENGIPEGEVLRHGKRWLERIEMPDIMGLFPYGKLRIPASEGDLAARGRQKPRDEAKER